MSINIKRTPASYKWEDNTPLLMVDEREIEILTSYIIMQVISAKYEPDIIFSIGQSGVNLGLIVSRVLGKPHAIFRAKSYRTSSDNYTETQHGVIIADHSLFIDSEKGLTALPQNISIYYKRVLLVDHLIDSGNSIDALIKKLQARHTENFTIHTACLWLKSSSQYKPNYFGNLVEPEESSGKMPWIVEPKDTMIKKIRDKINIY